MKIIWVLLLAVLAAILVGAGGRLIQNETVGTTLTVCPSGCQFARIQEAIDAAEEGDMIRIEDGLYQENLVVNKRVTLSGTSSEGALLRALVEDKPVVLIKGAQGVTLAGMTISGAEIGVQMEEVSANILDNKIIVEKFGIKLMNFEAVETIIQGNEITANGQGVGIQLLGKSPCLINDNHLEGLATGIIVAGAVVCDIRSNRISNGWDGLLIGSIAQATIIGNQIFGNYNDGVNLSEVAIVQMSENKISENDGWGVSFRQQPCYETEDKFIGSVEGLSNEIVNNGRGDLCPKDYPWPQGFVKGS